MLVQISAIPRTLEQLKAMPQSALRTPEDTAALTVAALCAYPESPEACYQMLDYLRGPRPLSPMEKQFIRDRFMDGKDYIPRSYFLGASLENGYTPKEPLTVEFTDSLTPWLRRATGSWTCGAAAPIRPGPSPCG